MYIYVCMYICSYQEVTGIYCSLPGSMVGCFQYPGILFLLMTGEAQPEPFVLDSVQPDSIPHDPKSPNSGRVKRRGEKGHSFRESTPCWKEANSPSGAVGM